MKPVAIFRHFETEGPGYFATFLAAHSIPSQLIAIDQGETVPGEAGAFSGLCLMGGPMSVNDDLPWIDEICALIRDAATRNIPVLGHCLGGQLMSKALGGTITRNPVKEIGWGTARGVIHDTANNDTVHHWLGNVLEASAGEATVFHWHGETFSVPPGATHLMCSADCANQMFTLGPHLGMQCHVEMTPEMIAEWCKCWPAEVAGISVLPPSIQTPEIMLAQIADRLPTMHRLAERLYSVWIAGLNRR